MLEDTLTQTGMICESIRHEIDRLLAIGRSPTGYTITQLKSAHKKNLKKLTKIPVWVKPLSI